ncbi:MAG: hypothetical protein U0441_16775 [Polyangiaceae bacterium]
MGLFGSPGDVFVGGRRVKLDPAASIGKGGEADVYRVGRETALKVWKGPDHPDFAGDSAAKDAAARRIEVHQKKMSGFPRGLPGRVVAPRELATDKGGNRILGYTMGLVDGAEVLLRYGDAGFRSASGATGVLGKVLADLHRTVEGLHSVGVVIGDFNDLNVLVRGEEAHLIDVDSFQVNGFACEVYTERFLDPLLADPNGARPVLSKGFGVGSDWYAFAVMAMQTLLCVGPYGGIYRARGGEKVAHDARPLRRITVFHPEVVYPKPAVPWSALPDEIVHSLVRTFERDDRTPLSRQALEGLEWRSCGACGLTHARVACPRCTAPVIALPPPQAVNGRVTRTIVRETRGRVIAVAMQEGCLRYLVHEDGGYLREDGFEVLKGGVTPGLRFWIFGERTIVGRGGDLVEIGPDGEKKRFSADLAGKEAALATNGRCRVRVLGGQLLRSTVGEMGRFGEVESRVGDVLSGQTEVWLGDKWGFGTYRAGALSVAFLMGAERGGLADQVKVAVPAGQVIGQEVVIGQEHVWVICGVRAAGRTVHVASRIDTNGVVDATAQAEAGDGSWLGSLGGKCAVGGKLLCPTDAGVVRVDALRGALVEERRFTETEPFVSAASTLLANRDGLYVADAQAIARLQLG